MVNDNYSRVVSRNYTNQAEVSDAGLPSSAFDNSYQSWFSGVLGRLHIAAYQHVIPGTKYRGTNSIAPTFEQVSSPIMPDMLQRIHNFYVPDFAVNRDFRDKLTLNEKNGYNRTETIGAFSPAAALLGLANSDSAIDSLLTVLVNLTDPSKTTVAQCGGFLASASAYSSFTGATSSLSTDSIYATASLEDLRKQVASRKVDYASITTKDIARQVVYNIAAAIFDFYCGQGSVFDMLGYPYISHDNLRVVCQRNTATTKVAVVNLLFFGITSISSTPLFSDTALRKYQSIWIAFYRNVQIQKLGTNNYLDYHRWDNSLSLGTNPSSPVTFTPWHLSMFLTRVCPWSEDLFTSAQTDDLMRHVYAPLFEGASGTILQEPGQATSVENATNTNKWMRFMTVQQIGYKNELGVDTTISLPVPSILNRSINALTYGTPTESVYGLDLYSMKRAQMLERYLKRGHYFGTDEYRDIIKGQYGVDISDLRLNRPHFLGGSTAMIDKQQLLSQSGSTTSAGSGSFGQRVATATGNISGDTFTDFAEEWGTIFSLFSIIPQVQYDPLCIQNTQIYPSDFPVPVYSQNFEAIIPTMALNRNKYYTGTTYTNFGHAPYAFQYRSRVNEVHGKFLDEYAEYLCSRFFGLNASDAPKLNSTFLECHPEVAMFLDDILLDGQFFAVSDHKFYTECPLAAPVEVI